MSVCEMGFSPLDDRYTFQTVLIRMEVAGYQDYLFHRPLDQADRRGYLESARQQVMCGSPP